MIKKEDIFIGTIKLCKNFNKYKVYGDISPDCIIGTLTTRIEVGGTPNVDIICSDAVLIKVDEDKYVWFKTNDSIAEEILFNLGLYGKVLTICPSYDEMLYVEKGTLKSYYENPNDEKISSRKLKKELLKDPRLPGRIQN